MRSNSMIGSKNISDILILIHQNACKFYWEIQNAIKMQCDSILMIPCTLPFARLTTVAKITTISKECELYMSAVELTLKIRRLFALFVTAWRTEKRRETFELQYPLSTAMSLVKKCSNRNAVLCGTKFGARELLCRDMFVYINTKGVP